MLGAPRTAYPLNSYGPIIDSQAGLSVLMGYEGEPARKGGVAWPDPVAGMHAAFATLVAVAGQRSDGRGRTVEVAQLEATVAMIGHALIDTQLSGRPPERMGNRDPVLAPSGVYRCRGADRWIALSVIDAEGWRGLCRLVGADPSWSSWDVQTRHGNARRIDAAIAGWAADREQADAVTSLAAAGPAAAIVADAAQVVADPHLRAQGFFVTLDHPEAGSHPWPRIPITLDATPATYRRPAPCLNQHGDEILRDVLGLPPEEVARLRASGVITDRPPDDD